MGCAHVAAALRQYSARSNARGPEGSADLGFVEATRHRSEHLSRWFSATDRHKPTLKNLEPQRWLWKLPWLAAHPPCRIYSEVATEGPFQFRCCASVDSEREWRFDVLPHKGGAVPNFIYAASVVTDLANCLTTGVARTAQAPRITAELKYQQWMLTDAKPRMLPFPAQTGRQLIAACTYKELQEVGDELQARAEAASLAPSRRSAASAFSMASAGGRLGPRQNTYAASPHSVSGKSALEQWEFPCSPLSGGVGSPVSGGRPTAFGISPSPTAMQRPPSQLPKLCLQAGASTSTSARLEGSPRLAQPASPLHRVPSRAGEAFMGNVPPPPLPTSSAGTAPMCPGRDRPQSHARLVQQGVFGSQRHNQSEDTRSVHSCASVTSVPLCHSPRAQTPNKSLQSPQAAWREVSPRSDGGCSAQEQPLNLPVTPEVDALCASDGNLLLPTAEVTKRHSLLRRRSQGGSHRMQRRMSTGSRHTQMESLCELVNSEHASAVSSNQSGHEGTPMGDLAVLADGGMGSSQAQPALLPQAAWAAPRPAAAASSGQPSAAGRGAARVSQPSTAAPAGGRERVHSLFRVPTFSQLATSVPTTQGIPPRDLPLALYFMFEFDDDVKVAKEGERSRNASLERSSLTAPRGP